MRARELVDDLLAAIVRVGGDAEVMVETERGGDPGTPLVISEVETSEGAEYLVVLVTDEQPDDPRGTPGLPASTRE